MEGGDAILVIGRKTLAAGTYRTILKARTAKGDSSIPVAIDFKVAKG